MWKHFAVNFKKYLALRGRSSRLEFWSFVTCSLMLLLVGVAITGIFYTLEHFFNLPIRLGSVNPATIGVILFFLTALILVMPFISIAVRRVHDVGFTGWLILIPGVNLILWCMPSKNRNNYFESILSGGLTYAMFRPCCMILRKNLMGYNLCNPEFYRMQNDNETIVIENIDEETT